MSNDAGQEPFNEAKQLFLKAEADLRALAQEASRLGGAREALEDLVVSLKDIEQAFQASRMSQLDLIGRLGSVTREIERVRPALEHLERMDRRLEELGLFVREKAEPALTRLSGMESRIDRISEVLDKQLVPSAAWTVEALQALDPKVEGVIQELNEVKADVGRCVKWRWK